MPWNWRKNRAALAADANRHSQQREQHLQSQHNTNGSAESSSGHNITQCHTPVGSTTNDHDDDDNAYETTNTVVRRLTPVLFSTNRGLYLRTAKPLPPPIGNASMGVSTNTKIHSTLKSVNSSRLPTACAYDLRFCDLERWSTNRANTVSLEDTFTVRPRNNHIATPNLAAVENSDSGSGSGNASGGGSHRGNNCFLIRSRNSFPMPRCSNQNPRRSTSLQNTFARFDIQ